MFDFIKINMILSFKSDVHLEKDNLNQNIFRVGKKRKIIVN